VAELRVVPQACSCSDEFRANHFAHGPDCPTRLHLEMAFKLGWDLAREHAGKPFEAVEMMPIWPCSVSPKERDDDDHEGS
jgi:hypothetical protein